MLSWLEITFINGETKLFDMKSYLKYPVFKPLNEHNNLNTTAAYHTMVKGDNLWIISRKYKTTVDNIVVLNGIKDSDFIVVGERIRIK